MLVKMKLVGVLLVLCGMTVVRGAVMEVTSPDQRIVVSVVVEDELSYRVTFAGKPLLDTSPLGFELKNEPRLAGPFRLLSSAVSCIDEVWEPVVRSKHAKIRNYYNELTLTLREQNEPERSLGLIVRVFDDGLAFRYKLDGETAVREITRELTSFTVSGDPTLWVANYKHFKSPQEAEFRTHRIADLQPSMLIGLPMLMECASNCWMAITEANIENYAGFYLGKPAEGNRFCTRLAPEPKAKEMDSVKVRFSGELLTPWRVILIGESPGTLIKSEIIQNLNEPCAIEDTSWIKPGISAWDHWWSGGVKMEMPVIKEYIDFAAEMGWEYMQIDWQWYGKYNRPEADITKWAPQLDLPEIIRYAKDRQVGIFLWMHSADVARNDAYKTAFPLYRAWGVVGVKVDFMDRDDQAMVQWYHDVVRCAAENRLLVNFHGAYKPDGIIRTWPNLLTREGVLGGEHYKTKRDMSAEHNVTLAFTRMLAGQMDYTPGAFLNVTTAEYERQVPTVADNTRAAELSKFVIYESPLVVVCDHPKHVLGQPGADFLKIVPTVWDDLQFLGGHPREYVALARRNGDQWFIGVMNNSQRKSVELKLDFLPSGTFDMEVWADAPEADEQPTLLQKKRQKVKSGDTLSVDLAVNGGFVSVINLK